MASCNYIPQIMLKDASNETNSRQIGSIRLDECNGKLMEGLKTLKALIKF